MLRAMQQIASGIRDVGRGLGVLRAHPRLWVWVIAPALITVVLLIATVAGILHVIDPLVAWLGAHLPGVLARIAGSLLTVIIVLALSFGGLVVFVSIAGMFAGPFNELLSERVEAVLTGRPPPPFSLAGFARDATGSGGSSSPCSA
jgi:CysZ protein